MSSENQSPMYQQEAQTPFAPNSPDSTMDDQHSPQPTPTQANNPTTSVAVSPVVEVDNTTADTTNPEADQNKPHVIAFVNHSSGSGKGDEITEMLTKAIGEENIYKLGGQYPPKQVLQDVYAAHQSFRIIVCGGDGSVNWILSVIADLGYNDVSVGIIPNGTGNDTSRYLGWGQCQFGSKYTQTNINKMCNPATPVREFDRWQLFMSFRKDEMLDRTEKLKKTKEVPMSHTWDIRETPPPIPQTETTSTLLKSQQQQTNVDDETHPSPLSSSTTLSVDGKTTSDNLVSYYFPRYFKCMLRLDEFQYLERYKWLHPAHQPIEFSSQSPNDRRLAQTRLTTNPHIPPEDDDKKDQFVSPKPNTDEPRNAMRKDYAQRLENSSKFFRFTWSFNNYFSLGVDAQAMNYFGIHRDNNPGCYLCRCCTLTWIGTCSAATCVRCQKKPLRYRIDILYKDGDLTPEHALAPLDEKKHGGPSSPTSINSNDGDNDVDMVIHTTSETIEASTSISNWAEDYEVPFIDNNQHLANGYKWLSATFDPLSYGALVLLNIPSYAGGRNIWGTKSQMGKKNADYLVQEFDQDTKDGRLELVAFTGFNQLQFTVVTQSATYRLGQIQGLRIYMQNDAFVQLDGEAWIQPQGVLEVFRSKPGQMLFNDDPDYPCC